MQKITIDLHRLAAYGNEVLRSPGELRTLQVAQLAGGETGARLYRLDLGFRLANGNIETVSVVQKDTTEREIRVMRALGRVPATEALPRSIACGESVTLHGEKRHWLVLPLYEGNHPTFDDEVPRSVVESLARVHAHFASRVEGLDWLSRLDAGAFRWTFDAALESLQAAHARQANPLLAQARSALRSAGQDPALVSAVELLPPTLVHGDVHPWNILRLPDGGSVLIDWGNAKLAPAMLDLANLVEIDSPNWAIYLSTWEGATGEAMDRDLARLGYYWATVMVNLQYLPYRAGQWPQVSESAADALDMVERLRDALGRMPALLRPS